jgi:exopolyphosphatase / guanosine-5'-triphosphate,3'-diphosphate pyrophosphatase
MSTRVAVVDLGSNSTRLLIADVTDGGALTEVERRSVVTRLGDGVEASGALGDEAMRRVDRVLSDYRRVMDDHDVETAVGVLTSAVRDAANGAAYAATVRERFGIAARTIPGEEEARLTYLGATSELPAAAPTAVIDIGGGSTEVIVGCGDELRFHVSTQVGVVRHSERHLHDDPPTPAQLQALRDDVGAVFARQIPASLGARSGLAVAGTATQSAAMLGDTTLRRRPLEELLERLAALPLAERRETPGLDADRAPTIVAGVAVLLESMRALDLDAVTASDHDILRGAALERSVFLAPEPPQF